MESQGIGFYPAACRWSRWASLVLAIGPIVPLGADSYGATYLIDIDFGPVTVVPSPKYAFRTAMFDRLAIWASRVRPPKQLAPELRLALLLGIVRAINLGIVRAGVIPVAD